MCRFALVINKYNKFRTDQIKCILWRESNSIFTNQSYGKSYTPDDMENCNNREVNLDGFGIGWRSVDKKKTYVYKNIIPSWNDSNFLEIVDLIDTKFILAHIRATDALNKSSTINSNKHTSVNIQNCHPFKYKDWLFCHNGAISGFSTDGSIKKRIINKISDKYIKNITGTTDTEYLFYLILSENDKTNDLQTATRNTYSFLNESKRTNWLNICISNSHETIVTRYVSKKNETPPSLYIKKTDKQIMVTSEPISKTTTGWKLIPKNTFISLKY
jgi:glutamine amidotransferase